MTELGRFDRQETCVVKPFAVSRKVSPRASHTCREGNTPGHFSDETTDGKAVTIQYLVTSVHGKVIYLEAVSFIACEDIGYQDLMNKPSENGNNTKSYD